MELTMEMIELIADGCIALSCGDAINMAKQLLAELDAPKVWENAPEWATKAVVNWSAPTHYSGVYKSYTRELPKSRIDEIAEEAKDLYMATSAGDRDRLTHIIKSAILKDREEREANR